MAVKNNENHDIIIAGNATIVTEGWTSRRMKEANKHDVGDLLTQQHGLLTIRRFEGFYNQEDSWHNTVVRTINSIACQKVMVK